MERDFHISSEKWHLRLYAHKLKEQPVLCYFTEV